MNAKYAFTQFTSKLVPDFTVASNVGTAQCLSNNLRRWQRCALRMSFLSNLTSEWYLQNQKQAVKAMPSKLN